MQTLGPLSDPDFLPKFALKFYLKNLHKMAKFDFFPKTKKYIWENSYKKGNAKNLRLNSKIERVLQA